jgi:fermentation-respiration switch protein FrsA (DUF1100 family)
MTTVWCAGIGTCYGQDPKTTGTTIEGNWQGALDVGGTKLRIIFRFTRQADGTFTGKLDSPDQGASGIPFTSVTYKAGKLRAEVTAIGGVYEGTADAALNQIAGQWSQSGQSFPLTLTRTEHVAEMRRPQVPKKPYPYDEQEVTFSGGADGVTLAGTLTLPKSGGPFPAVLLIAGSGPNKRDEEVFNHPVFLVLADYLTRHGIAVLRYDKRGVGHSTGDYAKATSEDFTADALAGVAYLKGRKEVRPDRLGLIGHSEGGLIAPLVATRSKDVKFIVMMAGPGLTGERIITLQAALIMKANGAPASEIEANTALQEKLFAAVKTAHDDAELKTKLDPIIAEAKSKLTDEQKKQPGAEAALDQQLRQIGSPWMRYFLTYDPEPALRKVTCPVLAINGEKDLQVPPKENLPVIEAALKAGGNPDYTVKQLPGLNHLFQKCGTGSPSEYGTIEETIDPTALALIEEWIKERTAK